MIKQSGVGDADVELADLRAHRAIASLRAANKSAPINWLRP
jgi:hypothetical protein